MKDTPARNIFNAKETCEKKILDAVREFEDSTGLPISGIEYHNDLAVKSFVDIVITI